jgi:hypothetical protein
MMRKVNSRRSCSTRDKAGMVHHGINYQLIDLPIGQGVIVGIKAFALRGL